MVTAAELLAHAAGKEGKFSQSFPLFGSEKRGPPVASYCRISDKPIVGYESITEPDIAVVADASVMVSGGVANGLKPNGFIVANYAGSKSDFDYLKAKIYTVDGAEIAMRVIKRPIYNTVMLGALLKITGIVTLDSISDAIRHEFSGDMGEKNVQLVKECYDATVKDQ